MSVVPSFPRTLQGKVVAGDLLRIGPDSDPQQARIMRAQIQFVSRHYPFALALVIANITVVMAMFAHLIIPAVLILWFAINCVMLSVWSWRGICARYGKAAALTTSRVHRLVAEMGLLGFAWGVLFMTLLPGLPSGPAMLVVAMMMATVGCTAFMSAIFPPGALAISGPIMVGTVVGVLSTPSEENWLVAIVIGAFILVVFRSNIANTISFLQRVRAQALIEEQEAVVRLLLNEFELNGREWLFEFDHGGRMTFASPRLAEVLQIPNGQLIGTHWTRFLTDRQSARTLLDAVRRGVAFRDHILKVLINGETHWWSLSGTPKVDPSGRLLGYRGVGADITDRQLSAQRIADLATFDSLTGLVNRPVIHAAIEEGLAGASGVALLFVDLDRFKAVNDTLGHSGGDRLLALVAARLREVVGKDAMVGRLGGDEFAVVLRSNDADAAVALGEALIERVSEPYRISEQQVLIGASIGLSTGPEDGGTVEELMRAADLALYEVKGKGRGSVRRFERSLYQQAEMRRGLEQDLRGALAAGEIWMAFQPIVNASTEQIVSFEGLMRWNHPGLGEISPEVFIPIAEEAGLICELGKFALNEACRAASQWPAEISISVNLSPLQFDKANLAEDVEQALEYWNVAPERLELELTESLFLEECEQTCQTLSRLKALGVSFALDDFGTGYSSLGYLQKIDFARVKIDRSFVRASLSKGAETGAIIRAIVTLAAQLGMKTTAEGTETRAEFEEMRRLGCQNVQGFYFGKPMTEAEAAELLGQRPRVECTSVLLSPIV